MKASELIQLLQQKIEQHGDREVMISDTDWYGKLEGLEAFKDADGRDVFIPTAAFGSSALVPILPFFTG